MVAETIIKQIQHKLAFLETNDLVIGIILYGSYITGDATPQSDIDLCIVTQINEPHQLYRMLQEIWQRVPVNLLKYDVRMFHELPLFIQKDVIEQGQVIYARDEPALYEYLYQFRKRWEEQKYRQQFSKEELASFLG